MNKEKTLIIVESPHKATKISSYLDDNYIVLASKGHIVDLAKGGKHGMGIDLNNNFKPHYIILDDKVDTLQSIMDAAKKCGSIILCSDPDREGEAIGYHLATRLDGINKPISRAEIHEITKKGVLEAIKNTREINMSLVRAQEARRILDRIVGFSASPFLMQTFHNNHLSAGRVQSVITKMIVEREKEIEAFKPEEYFTIQAKLAKDIQSFTAKYEGKINNKDTANKIKAELEDKLAKYCVSAVDADEEKKKPLPPLITAKLQQIMSKHYKINATRTMSAAQSLYEQGFITYMRTDSVRVSDDALKSVRTWLKDNNYDVPRSANVYKNKNNAQDAHEAIRPTDVCSTPDTMDLLGDEKEVYEAIWKYFVASQMKPAIYNTLKVSIQIQDTTHKLITSGKAIKYKGFLEILGTSDNNSIDIPDLKPNDVVVLIGDSPITLERKQTQPPPRYSEANLIETLEKKEIGRPSTYATLLSTITNRNYVEQNGNVFHPTDLGRQITNSLIQWFSFLEYDYTAKLEMELDKIAEAQLDYVQMLTSFYTIFREELKKAYAANNTKLCSKCDGMMRELTNKKGEKFLACNRYPACHHTESLSKIKNVA